jgi:parvulin-like peptidyl-prolyl isomerase
VIRRLALFLLLAACHDEPSRGGRKQAPPKAPPTKGPDRITYDHILIAFKGSYRRIESFRSQEEARLLAYSILDRVRSGADFELLKQEYSDDREAHSDTALGPYGAVEDGVTRKIREIPRSNFHPLLGHVIFRLKVHEVKMADWHAKDCPDGWHIVKRLK